MIAAGVFILWCIAAILSFSTGHASLLFFASMCLALETVVFWIDLRRCRARVSAMINQNASARPTATTWSTAGRSLMRSLEALGYRLNTVVWESRMSEAPVLKVEIPSATAHSLEKGDSNLQQLVCELSQRFNAVAAALILFDPSGTIKIVSHPLNGRRFNAHLSLFLSSYTQFGRKEIFGQRICHDQSSVLVDFSAFGIHHLICHPLCGADAREEIFGALWLGYSDQRPPLGSECDYARRYAEQIASHLRSSKKLEKMWDKIEEVELRDKQKSEFLAQMSHDIRSPLSNIKTILTVFKLEGFKPDAPELLEVALNNCESMAEMVEDILDYSRHRAGKLAARPHAFNLGECADTVFQNYIVMARLKGLELSLNLPAEECIAYADARQIKRVISNIVSNALKYTQSGFVRMNVERKSEDRWGLSVRDSGPGMSAERLGRLFVPFDSDRAGEVLDASNRLPLSGEGIGLGLAISRILTELNGGQVRVASMLDQGSEFEVLIPAAGIEILSANEAKLALKIG